MPLPLPLPLPLPPPADEAAAKAKEEAKTGYTKFWNEFGKALKMGVVEDTANRNRLAKLLRVRWPHPAPTSLPALPANGSNIYRPCAGTCCIAKLQQAKLAIRT